jgi:RIO-like serine/threonine protein kinase
MTAELITPLCERAERVLKEIDGVVSQSNVTQWELAFLKDMHNRGMVHGTVNQQNVLARIEKKVFPDD